MRATTSSGPKSRLALTLMLSSSLTLAAIGLAAPAQASPFDIWASSTYTYCDAEMLGKLWGIDTLSAKTQIGLKIQNGIASNIPSILAASRQAGNRCSFSDTGYTYNDAEVLSRVWGTSVVGAKAKIATYITNGQSNVVNGVLGHGPAN